MATGSIVLAIALEVVAGSLVSLSMVVQRHALIYPNPEGSVGKVPLLCVRIGRWHAWFVGLVMYGIASALKIVGFNLGPLTILGSIFVGALLVTNLFLGHWLLREEVTVTKVVGSLLVLCGSIVVIAATPSGVPTSFTSADMQQLLLSYEALYLASIVLIVLICFVFILYVERTYPPPTTQAARKLRASRAASRAAISPTSPPSLHVAHPTLSTLPTTAVQPSLRLKSLMVFVYPGSLGLNEAFVDICARAYSTMLVRCVSQDGLASCHGWPLYLLMGTGIPATFSTAYMLKVVYERFQTTLALPIEYSSLNLFSVMGGLLFFQEVDYMEDWQVPA